jgi:hypothetical protein
MKNKKGDLSINIIIVAAIALIVLVVMVAVFTGRISLFGIGVDTVSGAKKSCDVDIKGQWKTACDSTESARYGLFSDSGNHPQMTCCVAN